MSCLLFSLLSFVLISLTCGQGYISVETHSASQDYYFSLYIDNIDASSCGDSISSIQLQQSGSWRSNNQYYYESSEQRHRYAWDYQNVKFSDMEPVSLRINMGSGRTITLWGIVQDISPGNTYTSAELICDGVE